MKFQIFYDKVLYNKETQYFEQVYLNDGFEEGDRVEWNPDLSEVSSVTSMSIMCLTDAHIGAVSSFQIFLINSHSSEH